ncbi:hypothetical protein AVEN_144457-1 [Araneus ventricosus]|uniref:Uncharacterized protein n=1 Tax=Araneus ventricosus TaxID=182803 RepID=A0A4Y2E2Z8_ARAVE|nr:hypothetical protein AVEN_144457-1 [Araneus ventricosus]
MMRTTPHLATPSPSFRITAARQYLTDCVCCSVQQAPIYGGSSLESGFEPRTLQLRDLTIRPLRLPSKSLNSSILSSRCLAQTQAKKICYNGGLARLPPCLMASGSLYT